MSNDPMAVSSIVADLAQDTEYDAVHAAVSATERGRWFLTEYANRNRHADTDLVVGAIARMEAAIRGDSVRKKPVGGPDIGAAAKRIADIAFALRERSADAGLCDALDAAVRELCDACATPASVGQDDGSDQAGDKASARAAAEFEFQDGQKFAEAVAALAASFSSLSEDFQTIGELDSEAAAGGAPPPDDALAAPPPANGSSASYIAPPEFVFQPVGANGRDVESSGQPGAAHPLLPGPQLMEGPRDDPADLFEPAEDLLGITPASPAAAMSIPAAAAPPAVAPAAAQLRVATGSTVRSKPRPAPDPLAELRALSDEELIALFG